MPRKATGCLPKGRLHLAKPRHPSSRRKAKHDEPQGHRTSADLRQPKANGGRGSCAETAKSHLPSVRDLCEQIRAHHRERCFAMEQRKRMDNALGAYVRRQLGWNLGLSEKERSQIAKQAAGVISKAGDPRFSGIIAANKMASGAFVAIEKGAAKEMANLATTLPVWEQFKDVRGFGVVSLAVIIGEAGDLSNYSNHSKLWKRMGVAVMGDVRQGGLRKGAAAEDWVAHGYSPQRRSRLWTIGDTLIKGNRDGRYRTTYLQRKAYEIARDPEMKPIAAHRRAQRYMEKRLLRDLWQTWRGPITHCQGRPVIRCPRPHIPNATTIAAMNEIQRGL